MGRQLAPDETWRIVIRQADTNLQTAVPASC